MPVEMRVTTMEKGGSGNASTNTIGAKNNSYTLSESNPLYEASLRYKKKKEEELEQENQKKLSEKRESDKKKAEYFSKTIQPFVSAYNQIVDATKGYFEGWQDERESAYTKGMFTSLQENLQKLKNSVSDNSYLQEVMSPDDYEKAISDLDLIGSSLSDAVDYVSNASSVYSQFSDADSYNKHTRLSGMSADDLQKQRDALDASREAKKQGMTTLTSSRDQKKALDQLEEERPAYDAERALLTSYLNNAKYNEGVKKYGVDPKNMTYSEIKGIVDSQSAFRRNPDVYDFVRWFYDSKDENYWYGKKAEEFVAGLDAHDRYLYKKVADLLGTNGPGAVGAPGAVAAYGEVPTVSAVTKKVNDLTKEISERTGESEDVVKQNIQMAQWVFDAQNRAEQQEKISEYVGENAGNAVLANAGSVLMNIPAGTLAFLDQAGQAVGNKLSGTDAPVNPNTPGQSLLNVSNDIRDSTRKQIEKKVSAKLPTGANLGVFAYDMLMNTADVVAQSLVGGVVGRGIGSALGLGAKGINKAISATTGMIASSTAAANTVQESLEDGYSNGMAVARGAIAGAIESIVEAVQIDRLLKGLAGGDSAIKAVLKGALSEGTEEVVTNILTEDLVEFFFGNGTRISRLTAEYEAAGYSKEGALRKAALDVIGQDAETFVSAAITGAVFGGTEAAANRANDKANTKLAQDGINNRIGGIGEIEFLKAVNGEMASAAEEFNRTHNDAQYKAVDDEVLRRIQYIQNVKEDIQKNSSLRNVIGESGIQQEIQKLDANVQTLSEIHSLIESGRYDPSYQAELISAKEEDLSKTTEEQAKSQRNVLKAAQMYLSAFGSEKKAVEAAKKTAAQENARAAELSAERSRLTEALTTADETQKVEINRRIQEIGREIKRTARNVIRAGKVEKALGDQYRSAINSALGGNEKELSKRLTNALGREVKVAYDDNAKGFSSMKTGKDSSTLTVNPELILRTENALRQEFGEEYTGNLAKEKLVHEIAHAAARSDANFDAKVLDIYHLLRDNGLITDDDIDEAATREAYKDTLKRYMATEPAKAEVRRLVEAGNAEADAIAAVENAYIGEELVAQTLEWMERATNGQLSREILGEKRNIFVQALNRIAEIFRSVAAKMKGVDNVNAAKTAGFADKIERFAREFAERGVAEMNEGKADASQESAGATQSADNAQGNSGEGAVASSESEASTGTQGEDERQSLVIGEETAVAEEGDTRYSIKSMRHDIAEGKMFDDLVSVGVFSREEADTLRDNLNKLVNYMIPFAGTVDMNEEYGRSNRPFRAYKPNSDPLYVISLDFSTLCRKRLMTQYVIEQLQLRENRPMTAEEQIAIRSMLLDYRKQNKALQVACAMCYVEAARLKAPKQMERFFTNTEDILKTYFAKKDSEFNAKVRKAQEDFKVSRGYEADTPKSGMKGKDVTALNKMSSDMRRAYEPGKEQMAIIETAKKLPRSTFLTAANLTELSVNHPEIYDAYTSHIRASTRSKSLEGDIPYYYGDSEGIVSDSFIENVNAENGFRFDSWSDFQMKHMLDMITAVIELSVRKSKMHGYTKFPEMVRIFGKTGMMFNLSGVAAGNGFDADGNLAFSDVEGMAYEDAVKLRSDFPETAGFQCIGVSHDHIRALLRSGDIDYVIPYHTSGLNATLRRMVDIYGWKDYTGVQNAKKDPNAKKPANAENWQVEPVWSEFFVSDGKDGYDCMKKTAQRYIDMCHERGLIPKFDEFTDEPNYWKLLIDRKMVNQKTGALIEQKPVRPDFDFGLIEDEVKREVSEYDPKLEQDALNYVVDNFDAIGSRIRELKKIAPKKKLQTVGNEVLQAYAEGSKVVEDERQSLEVKPSTITAAMDADYMSAVERGDTETAQMMVDEAANVSMSKSKIRDKSGKLIPVYHGTRDMFYKFDTSVNGGVNGTAEGFGIYTSDNPEVAAAYGDRQIKMYANITKPATSTKKTITKSSLVKLIKDTCQRQAKQMVEDGEYDSVREAIFDTWVSNYTYTYGSGMDAAYRETAENILNMNDNDMDIVQEIMSGMAIRDYEEAYDFYHNSLTPITGIDGFVTAWEDAATGEKSNIILAFDSHQLKSADAVTKDDNGNVIPLSERFNTENDDIRYSLSDEQRMKRQAENIAFLKKQIQRGRSYAVSSSALDKVWAELRRGYGIDKADEQTVRDMFEIVDAMSMHKMDVDEGMARLNAMAREVLTNVYQVDDRLMRENEAFIQYIRSTPLSVPADNESDLGGKYGDYRNENRRYVNLSREGTPVESVYEQICDMFPGILDRSVTHPADQIHEIVDAMRSMDPEETPVYSEVLGSAAESFVSDIMAKMDRYSRETFRAKSDREKEILRENAERQAAAERNRSDVLRAREAEEYEKRVKRMETQNRNTVNAYEARIQGIETAAARDAMQYREIINNLQNRMDEISVKNDRRDYSSAIRRDARVIRSAAVSPNQKRYIPEEHRKTIERIAEFLDKVSRYNGTYRMDMADMAVYKDIQSLAPLYGEDFADTAAYLVNEIDWTAGADMAEDRVAPMVALRVANNAYKLGRLLRTSIARQNRMVLDGKSRNANYISGELIDSLNNRRNVEKEFNTLETDEKGKLLSSSDSGKLLERMEKRTRKTRKWISLNTMDGYSFLRRMGKVGDALYDTLRAAQSEQIMHVQEYVKTLQDKLLKDQQDGAKGVDLSRYIGDKQKTVTVTLSSGEKYTMTAAQAMTIVTLYEREAGKSHIENGGVRLVHPKDKTLSAAVALKAADVAAIEQKLDADDRLVMKVMNDFIREQCTEWGNEATLERYGFYRFNTQHYFPITVDRNALPSNVSAEGAKDYLQFNVQNVGFAKAADASAKAPVVIDSFINVINRHVEGMATYSAYLNAEDIVNRLMSAPGVKDAMQRSLGTGSVKYMTDMMTELKQGNRGGSEDSLTQWWNKSAGHYKSAAVSYNLSTALKQPISIVRAAAVLDPKYILAAKRVPFSGTGKAAHEEMMQYSGIGVKKSVGYSDVGVSRDINAQIGYEKKDLSKKVRDVSEFGMALAGYMDERTWDSIWIACREEVKDKKPDLTANHDAFMNEVAKRFAEVVAQTQVVDSPLDSSPLSRSKNPLARNVFAFTSEPIKGFNLLMNAMDDLINAEKGSIRQKQAAAQMARTAVITVVGWAAEASISAAFQMIRDEDDDEGEIAKEFGVKFGKQMLSNAYNAVPYVGQAVDIILDAWKGYDFTDMGIAPLVEVIDSAKSVMDTLRNPENKSETFVKAGRDLVESMATFFGIPIRNFNRDAIAAARLFFHSTDWYTAEYEMQKIFYNPKSSTAREKHEFNSLLTDAYLSGNKKAFEHIYNDMRSMGLSPQTIMNGIVKDAYAQDITSSGTTLTRYTPGSDAWYIGMKGIFDRDLSAPDGLEKELTRLYKATEEKGVLPKYKSDSYTVDGESREMSVKDHEAVLSEYSKLYYEIATILRNSPAYKNADDTLKAYWMAQAERYAGAISIYRVDSEYALRTKWWEKMKDKPYYDVAGYIITNLKPSKEDE